MSEVVITPPLGNSIPGYFHDRRSTGIRDELYAKALVVEADGVTAAFVAVDCLALFRPVVNSIRERVFAQTGIEPSHVMVSATHTHTGPPVSTTSFLKANDAYVSWMAERAADAVTLAHRKRVPARIGSGSGEEGDIAFNRRFFMKDGTVRTNPGVGNPDIDRPAGPTDPEVSVIRIDDLKGKPIGVVTNYACHTDVVGGTEYSGDYPGELSAVLKKALGPQTVSMFLMGASGNINHIDVRTDRMEAFAKPSQHHVTMGRILAGEVLKVREKIRTAADDVEVKAKQAFASVEFRRPSPEEISAARQVLRTEPPQHVECAFAQELLRAADSETASAEAEIQVFQIGSFAVVGWPGEMFVEFGLEVKAKSPFRTIFINELCNGSMGGYICTPEAFRQGGYEPRMTYNSRNAENTGERIVRHTMDLLYACHMPDNQTNTGRVSND